MNHVNLVRDCRTLPAFGLLILILCIFTSCGEETGKFVKLEPGKTGIQFTNTITENDSINIFDFSNIYNGGGVGVADFNNDGWQDLYFTGNMVPNKLYLNKGNMQFEDITGASQTAGGGIWSRGVAVVDINNDGKMDIYVCATAKRNPAERVNILFVNQGWDKNNIPVFKDMAGEYGLADTTQSTMAYFFDYDNDEDLDLYIGVNHIIQDEYTNAFRKRYLNGEHPSTGKLYRNDWDEQKGHPYFTDVSAKAGILIQGYTHAVNIADFDDDGWQDIFVANDYLSSNVLYINNHDGTFTDRVTEFFKHSAFNSMGSDVADINNDGLDDVIEVDMSPEDNYRKKMFQSPNNYLVYQNSDLYGYQYQYVRNMLHINQGPAMGELDSIKHPVFSDIGYFAGIAETDWSWTPLVADFDNDGYRDILFTTGFPKDITDHDFIAFRKKASKLVSKKDLLDEIPAVKIHNYIYRNNGGARFSDKTTEWGLNEPGFSNGAAYVDLDNDGDLDMAINRINDPASIYENKITAGKITNRFITVRFTGPSKNVNGIGAKLILYQKDAKQTFVNNPYRGYLSSISPVMHFGLGISELDSVEIIWPGNKKQVIVKPTINQLLQANIKNAAAMVRVSRTTSPEISRTTNWFTNITTQSGINYVHQQRDFIDFNIQKLLPHKLSEYSPGIAAGDINGDGLDDFITGAAPNYSPMVFMQNSKSGFTTTPLVKAGALTQKASDDRGLLLFDADADNDLDLFITAGGYAYESGDRGYADILYVNDGKGNFAADTSAIPFNVTSKFCTRASDYDKDGDLDLFIAGRIKPWNYPQPVSSFIYRNDSKAGAIKFTDVSTQVAPVLTNIGLVCDALFTDFDNDGWQDLLLAGEWMSLRFLKNEKGSFKDMTQATGIGDKSGWWNSITSGDFDNDGDIDYIAGNLGENSYYKAGDAYPVSIYTKDFDRNGVVECIPTKYIRDRMDGTLKEFTAHTRDDIVEPMPFVKKRFLTYKAFAAATFNDLFTPDEIRDAAISRVNYLKSTFIRNNGNGKFVLEPLPDMAQYSTINGMITDDFDGDGNLDVCMNTNDYSTEPGNGRYDALNGLVLKGDGKGGFRPLSILQSGIYISGNGKGMAKLLSAEGNYLIAAAQNRGPLQVYKNKMPAKTVRIQPGDVFAVMTFSDGRKQKQELYYGSSFLSQGSRFIVIPGNITSCTITDGQGRSRSVSETGTPVPVN